MTQGNDLHRRIYVGTHDGVCALNTSDGGITWKRGKMTPLANAAARLSVSPVEPSHAYLAAYEAGVFKTVDGGDTWRHLTSYPTGYAHSVLAHPKDPGTVFVGSEPAALFRSSDGGESWEECAGFQEVPESDTWTFHGGRLSHVRELRTEPGDPDTMYAGIEVGGIVKSSDGGKSWTQMQGLHDDIHLVNISDADPRRVYVATAQAPYRSDDGGGHWEVINNGLERRYTLHISAAPHDADLVLVTVSENARRSNPQFYRSTDGGNQWKLIESVGAGDDMVVAIDWDPVIQNRVYAGTDSGKIYCSDDAGQQWTPVQVDLPTIAIGAMVVAATSA
ncbi:MAG: hypothetical protein IIC99_05945 [Chloroflexi bacterium]|nr:hypothetical protein [Chloroflexota bacterium]